MAPCQITDIIVIKIKEPIATTTKPVSKNGKNILAIF